MATARSRLQVGHPAPVPPCIVQPPLTAGCPFVEGPAEVVAAPEPAPGAPLAIVVPASLTTAQPLVATGLASAPAVPAAEPGSITVPSAPLLLANNEPLVAMGIASAPLLGVVDPLLGDVDPQLGAYVIDGGPLSGHGGLHVFAV